MYWRFTICGEKGFIEVKAGSGFIDVALTGDENAVRVEADAAGDDYTRRFFRDIENKEDTETKSVLNITRRVLEIQAFADRQNI